MESMSLRRGLAIAVCLSLVILSFAPGTVEGRKICWTEWINADGVWIKVKVCIEVTSTVTGSVRPGSIKVDRGPCHLADPSAPEDEFITNTVANHTGYLGYLADYNESYTITVEEIAVEGADTDYLGIGMQILWMLVIVVLFPIAFWLSYRKLVRNKEGESE